MSDPTRPPIELVVDGRAVSVADDGSSLLEVLRDQLGVRSVKDGCSPQGQCGCCTVLVDGQARVSCVTPIRRVAGRDVVTVDGLDPAVAKRWDAAFETCGASQCGFCTPGIICRFEALRAKGTPATDTTAAAQALKAHLCRCTGWQTVLDAWQVGASADPLPSPTVDRHAADLRATLEGGTAQRTGEGIALGRGGFSDDSAPDDALVAVRRADGDGWAVAESLSEARQLAGKVQGRRTTEATTAPLDVPPGTWDVTLRTGWVEPAYLETDASWCLPGGEPKSPLANGGAFGAKVDSDAPATARRLADQHGRPVRVLWSREDVVRFGPKRPPIAAGVCRDGTGVVRVVETPGIERAIHTAAPGLSVEQVAVAGPPTSASIRAAGWAEATILMAAARGSVGWIVAPGGGEATASVADDGTIEVAVRPGRALDETVLRSYVIGAAHMALGWVCSEGLSVDSQGEVGDLTIRSFGIVRAADMPTIRVEIDERPHSEPKPVSDAVLAAVAAAVWLKRGTPQTWPDH